MIVVYFLRAPLAVLLTMALVAPLSLEGEPALAHGIPARPLVTAVSYPGPVTRVHVIEPLRGKPMVPRVDAIRATVAKAVKPVNPRFVAGFPMFKPRELDAATRAAAGAHFRSPASAVPVLRGERHVPSRGGTVAQPLSGRNVHSLPSYPAASGTGINPWWRYQEGSVPGGGEVMVNVGTGNLVLQDDDMMAPHKGVAMALRRTYNSQSRHDAAGSDGSVPGMYGTGWTNTFDAHIAKSADGSTESVYDIDGTRYDYALTHVSGTYWVTTPPPGVHATLTFDGNCGFLWTKKNGTSYYFYRTYAPATNCPMLAVIGGYAGRLHQIIGRNRNTFITFNYTWDNGDASTSGKISGMTATTESGMTATLSFADFNGRRLLQQLTYPDGITSVSYSYDAQGNLLGVSLPPNNAAGTRPQRTYGYQTIGSDSEMLYAASPRWSASCAAGACGYDGGYLYFTFSGASAATSTLSVLYHGAVVNPTIPDGTNTALQPGYQPQYANYSNFVVDYYTTGVATPTFRDTDGHMTNWVVDGTGRPTQTQECTASTNQGQQCTGILLTTNESWDADNNRISDTDARNYETDYAYDANGNTIAVAQPAPAAGAFRPTKLISYDAYNNPIAYCDPVATHSIGADWVSPPTGDNACPRTSVATRMVWSVDPSQSGTVNPAPSYEPLGEIVAIISPRTPAAPSGFRLNYSYDANRQGGQDFGLQTSVQADQAFTQADNSSRLPRQDFWYDANGDIVCYAKGNGYWVLAYDPMGRPTTIADPDDSVGGGSGVCSKTGQASWNTATTTQYFPNGSIATTQTPPERNRNVARQVTYDLDGNQITEVNHFGVGLTSGSQSAGVTTKWYDGADRLVEVSLPWGTGDALNAPWMTRYLYDLTAGGTMQIAGTSFKAYGGRAITEEYMPQAVTAGPWNWILTGGTALDAADRLTTSFAFSPGATSPYATQYQYDAPGLAGLASYRTDGLNQQTAAQYDHASRLTGVAYTNATSATYGIQYTLDPDGRHVSETSALFGTQTNQFDATGNLISRLIPAYGPIPQTTLSYDYYPDGMGKDVNIASATLTQAAVLAWSYRGDGRRQATNTALNGAANQLSETWTNGGRKTGDIDTNGSAAQAFDANGQLSSMTLPSGSFTSITHDAEGAAASFTGYANLFPPSGTSVSLKYTIRGELLGAQYTPDYPTDKVGLSASHTNTYGNIAGGDVDMRTKMTKLITDNDFTTAWQYDAVGRLTSSQVEWLTYNSNGAEQSNLGTMSKSYDAENHLVADTRSNYIPLEPPVCPGSTPPIIGRGPRDNLSLNYAWNVDGHPWMVNGTGVIWSDGVPLVAYKPSGALDAVYVDNRGYLTPGLTPNPLVVFERNLTGTVAAMHTQAGHGSLTASDVPCIADGATGTNGAGGTIPAVLMWRTDGIWDGYNTIQGVRSYDASVMSWSTPDAYKGSIHDPMSAQAYMWNRNNPYMYSDPSGFDPNALWIPAGVWRAPLGIDPQNRNPHADSMSNDYGLGIGVGTVATTLVGLAIDGAKLTVGGAVGLTIGTLVALYQSRNGIAPGYYAQTVYRANGYREHLRDL